LSRRTRGRFCQDDPAPSTDLVRDDGPDPAPFPEWVPDGSDPTPVRGWVPAGSEVALGSVAGVGCAACPLEGGEAAVASLPGRGGAPTAASEPVV